MWWNNRIVIMGVEMTKDNKFFILGNVFHQDDTNPVELLCEKDTEKEMSDAVSNLMNGSFPPKNVFVIEGVKRKVFIKSVSVD